MLDSGREQGLEPDGTVTRRLEMMHVLMRRLGGEGRATFDGVLCTIIAYNGATGMVTIDEGGFQREADPETCDLL
ncbi:MAG TPA: hypothetical protein VFL98_00865 [Candidatus Paceibacterota bacterium]|nr:hypothetical protein [Candidatus Paceibacterota bacterium]